MPDFRTLQEFYGSLTPEELQTLLSTGNVPPAELPPKLPSLPPIQRRPPESPSMIQQALRAQPPGLVGSNPEQAASQQMQQKMGSLPGIGAALKGIGSKVGGAVGAGKEALTGLGSTVAGALPSQMQMMQFQENKRKEELQDKLRWKKIRQGLTEGGERIGYGLAQLGGAGMGGAFQVPERFGSAQNAKELAQLEKQLAPIPESERLSPTMRAHFEKVLGLDPGALDEGVTKGMLQQFMSGQLSRERLDVEKERMGNLQEERKMRRGERQVGFKESIAKGWNKNKRVQDQIKAKDSVKKAIGALQTNDMGSVAAEISAARASGEVGALSESDKAPFKKRIGLLGTIDSAHRLFQSEKSPESKKQLLELLMSYDKAADEALRNEADRYISQQSKVYNFESKEIKDIVNVDALLSSSPSTSSAPMVGGKRKAKGPNGEVGTLPSYTDLSQYPGWEWID